MGDPLEVLVVDGEEAKNELETSSEIPVRVAVRIRPFAPDEEVRDCEACVSTPSDGRPEVCIGPDHRRFTFDAVYDEAWSQQGLFGNSVADLVEGVLEGYNATVIAYGQTGSGKTYTMGMGAAAARMAKRDAAARNRRRDLQDSLGVLPRVCKLLFDRIRSARAECQFAVRVSYLEVYNEAVRDLLAVPATGKGPLGYNNPAGVGSSKRDKLTILDNGGGDAFGGGVSVQGANQVLVTDLEQVLAQVELGAASRTTGATLMNAKSSRSHAIFSFVVDQLDAGVPVRSAKFHLVDLAGSERNKRTGAGK